MKNTIHLTLIIAMTAIFSIGAPSSALALSKQCMSKEDMLENLVKIGHNTGFLYNSQIVITNNNTINQLNNENGGEETNKVNIYIPHEQRYVSGKVLYKNKRPDLAIIKLDTSTTPNGKEVKIKSLRLANSVRENSSIFLASIPFGELSRMDIIRSWVLEKVRFSDDSRSLYYEVTLSDWSFSGDNGGVFYNCQGEVAGIYFGGLKLQDSGSNSPIYMINTRAISEALAKAGV